jgi:Xaa-Pro dipeptidase
VHRARADDLMAAEGIDGLIATTTENFVYATDFLGVLLPRKTLQDSFWAVVPRGGPIGMLCPRIKLVYGAQADVPVDDIRSYGTYSVLVDREADLVEEDERFLALRDRSAEEEADPFVVLLDLLRERGLDRGVRLGVDELGLSHREWDRLSSLLPGVELVDAYDLFREIRKVKTDAEIARMREGLSRTHDAVRETIAYARPGMAQHELRRRLWLALADRELLPRSLSVGVGPSSAYSFTEPLDHRLEPGSFVKLDPNALWRGYFADTGRTGIVGAASARQEAAFAAVLAGQQAGLDAVRPGVRACDVFAAIRDTTRDNGLPDYDPIALGHSIGLEIYDHPAIAVDDETILEPGMLVNVEVPFYEIGFGGIQIEDTVLVTTDGSELLSDLERDLFVVA